MKVSFNWLCDYVEGLDKVDPFELASEFTLKSFEVEEVIDQKKEFEHMVVGQISKLSKHPDADKLVLAQVDVGKKKVQIVCGCTNLAEGQLVLVTLPGARVRWHGEGDLVELQETKVRGQKSHGMIATAVEVGLKDLLGQEHDREACVLDATKAKPGTPVARALGLDDFIIDVDNKTLTNRPDLWGHAGIAREAAAITGKKFTYRPSTFEGEEGSEKFEVEIRDPKACHRYSGVLMSGIKIGPSPEWMQKRLVAAGMRPISNVVDITNYVMLEIGQPTHAFDAAKLHSPKVIADGLKAKKKVTALDGKEYELPKGTAVIRDEKGVQAVAGIIGGANSEIDDKTEAFFFESANFDAASIRRASTAVGLRTDASARHEKTLDPEYCLQATYRAIELVQEFCPGARVASKILDDYPAKAKPVAISTTHEYLEKKIGVMLKKSFVIKTLESLEFGVEERGGGYQISVPSFRATKDVSNEDDIVEEIARIYGYANIEPKFPVAPIAPPNKLPHLELERRMKDILARDFGFWEAYLHVFEDEAVFDAFGYDRKKAVEIQNAIQKDLRFLKLDLVPGLLRTVKKNERQYAQGKLFEIGRVFDNSKKNKEGLPDERRQVVLATFGPDGHSFSGLKGCLEGLFSRLGADAAISFAAPKESQRFLSSRHAIIESSGTPIGFVGEASDEAKSHFGIKTQACVAQLDFGALLELSQGRQGYQEIAKFPSIELDISIVVPAEVLWYNIKEAVQKESQELIRSVEAFDVFQSASLGQGLKSIALRITYRSDERTLSMEEVMPIQEGIMRMLERKFAGKVRS